MKSYLYIINNLISRPAAVGIRLLRVIEGSVRRWRTLVKKIDNLKAKSLER
jgi:hypothetical protein